MTGSKELYNEAIIDLASIHNDTDRQNKISESMEELVGLLILDDHARHSDSPNYDAIIDKDTYGQLMLSIGIYMQTTDSVLKTEYSHQIVERLVLNANKYFLRDIYDDIEEKREEILESKYEDEAYDTWANQTYDPHTKAETIGAYRKEGIANQIFKSQGKSNQLQRNAGGIF